MGFMDLGKAVEERRKQTRYLRRIKYNNVAGIKPFNECHLCAGDTCIMTRKKAYVFIV